MMRTAVLRLAALLLALALVACGGKSASSSPAPQPTAVSSPGVLPTSDQLCQLLTVGDWTAVGLSGATAPHIDDDGPGTGSAYCTYGGLSGATGGLELDVFVDATIDGAGLTFATIAQSLPPSEPPNISGIDEGLMNTNIDPGFGAILVRAGKLVVTITLPTSAQAGDQLTSLTQTVLSRALAFE
ncbi:MAG: hypothetical protein ABI744_03295 [Chloroflexota bacterium]